MIVPQIISLHRFRHKDAPQAQIATLDGSALAQSSALEAIDSDSESGIELIRHEDVQGGD